MSRKTHPSTPQPTPNDEEVLQLRDYLAGALLEAEHLEGLCDQWEEDLANIRSAAGRTRETLNWAITQMNIVFKQNADGRDPGPV